MLQIGPWYVIFTFYICIYITYVCASVFYYLSSKKAPLEGKGGVCFVHSHFSSAYALVDAKKNICGVKRWENEWRYTIYTSCLVQGLTHSKSPRKVSRFSHCLLRHGLVWPSRHVGLTSTDPTSPLPSYHQNDLLITLLQRQDLRTDLSGTWPWTGGPILTRRPGDHECHVANLGRFQWGENHSKTYRGHVVKY